MSLVLFLFYFFAYNVSYEGLTGEFKRPEIGRHRQGERKHKGETLHADV